MGGILKKIGILLAILLLFSPVALIFMGNNNETIERINGLIQQYLPGFGNEEEIDEENMIVRQTEVEIADELRNNLFLPGRQYLLNVPQGFSVRMITNGIQDAGHMTILPDQSVLVVSRTTGIIQQLGIVDGRYELINESFYQAERNLYDVTYHDGYIYYYADEGISRKTYTDGEVGEDEETLVEDLPRSSGNRAVITSGPDGRLYFTVSASCLLCEVEDERQAKIFSYDIQTQTVEEYASGLREVEAIRFDSDGMMIVPDKKAVGPDQAPAYAEINPIEQGANYGWPNCYEDKLSFLPEDTEYCQSTRGPQVLLTSRSEPTDLLIVEDENFPAYMQGKQLVAQNGSFDAGEMVGFQLVLVDISATEDNLRIQQFARGWLLGNDTWGRPFSLLEVGNGVLLISDSYGGAIYEFRFER